MSSGLLVPPFLPQPFDVRYVRDDLHVMAYINGHSEYEAVEAMIRFAGKTEPAVRAILTRHDQSQIDHVNVEAVRVATAAGGREVVFRDVDVVSDLEASLPRVRVRFESYRNETVSFELVCASPPDISRGGISDPIDHAANSSLPIMSRGRSAMAGPSSHVEISGTSYVIPEKIRAGPHCVAHHGFFTLSHHMGMLRAGRHVCTLLDRPASFRAGEQWVCATSAGRRIYRIDSTSHSGEFLAIVRTDGPTEQIEATYKAGELRMRELHVGHSSPSEGITLSFGEDGAFSIAIDRHGGAVVGTVTGSDSGLHLVASEPAWARRRSLRETWSKVGAEIVIDASIGPP